MIEFWFKVIAIFPFFLIFLSIIKWHIKHKKLEKTIKKAIKKAQKDETN